MKALVLAALVLIAGCAHRVPVVGITPGLHPRLTAAAAEQLARDAIDAMDIIRPGSRHVLDVEAITAIPGGPTVGGYLAGVSWIVRARGDFLERVGFWTDPAFRAVGGVILHIFDDDGSLISADFTD